MTPLQVEIMGWLRANPGWHYTKAIALGIGYPDVVTFGNSTNNDPRIQSAVRSLLKSGVLGRTRSGKIKIMRDPDDPGKDSVLSQAVPKPSKLGESPREAK